ncbi:MAG: hypothetical protein KY458_14500 [Actinobacteria bacterium]|nr:hypothetical protein [Actinomycetota bacterium]
MSDGAVAPEPELSLQERLETTAAGRWVLSAVLVFTLGAVAAWNLPSSALRDATLPVVEPYVRTVGLDQTWNLFAPDPPRTTFEVLARIEYADGTSGTWRPPRNDRWRKWLGAVRLDRNMSLWVPTAAWIAGHHDHGGRRPVTVTLVRRGRELLPPGSGTEAEWQEHPFFTYRVPGESGG